jgi:hypothetical protein
MKLEKSEEIHGKERGKYKKQAIDIIKFLRSVNVSSS